MILRVALLQLAALSTEPAVNAGKGEAFCRRAAAMGADIALFPEMWSIGYARCPPDAGERGAWLERAVDTDSGFVERFRRLAADLDMAIGVTYLQRWPGAPRNALSLIDRHGAFAFTYAKVHTCAFDWEAALTPGDEFLVAPLDTKGGPVNIGAMICFDREFPESARVLMLRGAEVILTPNACGLEQHRVGQVAARAFENMTAIAVANYPAPKCNGRSLAFDGMAFEPPNDEGDDHPRDMLIVEADDREGIHLAEFDIDRLREYRRTEVWAAWRRPSAYGPLTSPGPPPPTG